METFMIFTTFVMLVVFCAGAILPAFQQEIADLAKASKLPPGGQP